MNVCQMPEQGSANPAKTKHKAKEDTGNHSHIAWHQLLGIHLDAQRAKARKNGPRDLDRNPVAGQTQT